MSATMGGVEDCCDLRTRARGYAAWPPQEVTMGRAPQFTLNDQSGAPWALADHLDAAAVLIFYRGDW